MAESLSTFIATRLADLTAKQGPLRAELMEIEKEIDQLKRAAEAAGIVVTKMPHTANHVVLPEHLPRSVPEKTIKEAVLAVLEGQTAAHSAADILAKINAHLGVNYPRTSLSPQLSRLKADGLLVLDKDGWRIAPKNQKTQPRQTDLEDALK